MTFGRRPATAAITSGRGRRRVTAGDVAALAGVSRSAVSRALTEGASVSEETRKKVMRAASELGYHRNALVRGMRTQRSGIVGVIVGDLMNPFMTLALHLLALRLQRDGLKPLIYLGDGEADLRRALPGLMEYRVDGCFFLSTHLSPSAAAEYTRLDIPLIVMFNSYLQGISEHGSEVPVGAVSADNVEAARRVADLFLDAGHQRIALIEGIPEAYSNKERVRGFTERLAERGVRLVGHEIGNYLYADGRDAARRLFAGKERPTALFCCNDAMAMGALDTARSEFGLTAPGDIAVVGFDDVPAAGYPAYDLTTVRQPISEMIDVATDMMLRLIEEPTKRPLEIRMRSDLVRRGSTG